MINLMEIENLEARFIREFGIKNLSYIIDLDTWARDGIHAMRIPKFYTIKDKNIKITNGKGAIRINTDMLVAAYYCYDIENFSIANSYELLIRNDNMCIITNIDGTTDKVAIYDRILLKKYYN